MIHKYLAYLKTIETGSITRYLLDFFVFYLFSFWIASLFCICNGFLSFCIRKFNYCA